MSKVSDVVDALLRNPGRQSTHDAIQLIRALEAVSSIHEAEPVAKAWLLVLKGGAEGSMFRDHEQAVAVAEGFSGAYLVPLYAHPAPISKGVTVKALEWHEQENEDGVEWIEACPVRYEVFHKASDVETLGVQLAKNGNILGFYPGEDAAKAAAQADFATLSHTAGEIEAGGEVADPTRYDMVKLTGSTTLLPAVRDDGEWVKYADHVASLAKVVAGFDRLAGTQNGIVHKITARAEAADKRIAELEAALKPFADFAPYVEMFVDGRAAQGGSPVLPTKHFRRSDFERARTALSTHSGDKL